jgi:hypothetical protein
MSELTPAAAQYERLPMDVPLVRLALDVARVINGGGE